MCAPSPSLAGRKASSPAKLWLAGLALAFLAVHSTQAANQTWAGLSGTSGNWSDILNWSGQTAAPGATSGTTSTDIATFNTAVSSGTWGGSASNPIVIDQTTQNIGGINFDTNAGSYFIGYTGSNSLYLTTTGTIQILSTFGSTNTATETINAPLVIEGSGGAYTFADNSAEGTLDIGGSVTAASGTATLTLSGTNTDANTISGNISNGTATSLGITKSGAGTWVLSGANSYSGPTTINAGTLQINGTSAMSSNSAFTIGNGGTLGLASNTNNATFNPASLAAFTSGSTYNLLVNSITSSGTGNTLILNGETGAFVGAVSTNATINVSSTSGDTLQFGTLAFQISSASGSAGGGTSTTFNLNGANVVLDGLSQTASGDDGGIIVSSTTGNSLTINGSETVSGARTLFATVNSGTLILSGAESGGMGSNYGFGATLNGGTLDVNNAGALKGVGNINYFYIYSGTLNNTSGTALTETGNEQTYLYGSFAFSTSAGTSANSLNLGTGIVTLETSPTINLLGSGTLTLGGVISGSSSSLGITTQGTGTLVLSSSNTFTGATSINGGIINYQNATAFGLNSAITVASGATAQVQGGITSTGTTNLTISGTGASRATGALENVSGNNSATMPIVLGTNSTISSDAGSLTLSGGVTGGYSLTLASQSSGNGTITLSGTVNNGGTITNNGAGAGTTTISGPVGANVTGVTESSTTSGLTLSGVTTYNTPVTITTGTLTIGSAGQLGSGSYTQNISDGGMFVYNSSAAQTLSGAISGSGGLTESAGTLTLSGSNSYNGATTISSGTLLFTGSAAMSANSALTLNGGTLALHSNSNATFTPASISNIVNGSTIIADQVTPGGGNGGNTLTLSGSFYISGNATLNLSSSSGDTLALGTVLLSAGSDTETLNASSGSTISIAGVTASGVFDTLAFSGAGNIAVLGSMTEASQSRWISPEFNQSGTVTLWAANNLQATTVITNNTSYNPKVYFNNGTTVLNNSGVFNVGTSNLPIITMGASGSNPVTVLLGGTSTGLGGGITVGGNLYSNLITVSDLTSGVITIGGQNTSGTNTWTNNFQLGASTNIGKSVTLVAAPGGEVDFTGRLLANGTDTTAGIVVGNSGNTGIVGLSGSNTYAGGATLSYGTLKLGNAYALGSGTFTINGGSLDSSVANLVIATNNAQNWNASFGFAGTQNLNLGTGAVTLGASPTVTLTTGTLTVGGPIGGGGYGITVAGNGTLLLQGTNSYSGATAITGGTLMIGGSGQLGSGSYAGNISDGANFVYNSSAAQTLSGQISGSGGLTESAGTLTLSGSNSYNGATTLNGGTLQLGNAYALGSGTLTIAGGTLDSSVSNLVNSGNNPQNWNASFGFAGTQNLNLGAGAVTLNATPTVTVTANTLTVGGNISGGFGLTTAGAGTLVLGGSDTYSGATTIKAGTLQLANANAAENSTVTIDSSNGLAFSTGIGTFNLGGLSGTSNEVLANTGGNPVTLSVGGNNASTSYTGVLSGSGGIVYVGANALALNNGNTFTGGLVIDSGTISTFTNNSLGGSANTVTLNAGAGSTATLYIGGAWVSNEQGSYVISGSGTNQIYSNWGLEAQVLTGMGAITLNNSNLNWYQIGNGGVRLSAGITGTGNVVFYNDTTDNTNPGVDIRSALNNIGTVTFTGSGGDSTVVSRIYSSGGSLGANVTSLIQNATMPLQMQDSDANFTGSVQVLSGSIQLQNASALDVNNAVSVASGATLDIQNQNQTIAGLNNVSGTGGTVTDSTATSVYTLTLGGSGAYSFGGVITATTPADMALTKSGAGTQLLSGSDGYTGATTINGGTLQIGNANALSTSAVTESGSGTLDLDGQTITNNLSLSGTGAGGNGGLINSNTGAAAEVLGDIASNNFTAGGAGNLTLTTATNNTGVFTVTKVGAGTLTLGGTTLNNLMTVAVNGGAVDLDKLNANTTLDWAIDRSATVTSGTLLIGATGTQINADEGVTVNGGAFDLGGYNTPINFLNGTGGIVTNSGTATAALTVGANQFGTSQSSGTFAGVLQNGNAPLALIKTGTSTLTLSGSNTYSGNTTVSGGTLQLANGSALGTSSVTVSNGATMDLDGQTISNALSLSGTGFGNLGALVNSSTGGAAQVLGNIANNSFTAGGAGNTTLTQLNAADAGGGAPWTLTKAGAGTLTLGGTTLDYLMALVVNGGTVVLDKLNANTTSDWAVDRGATITSGTLQIGAIGEQLEIDQGVTVNGGALDLGGYSTPINFLTGTGGIVTNSGANAATLTVGANQYGTSQASGTFAGVLQNGNAALALVKSGTSTLTLSGDDSYSGGTTINGGTLRTANANALGSAGGSLTVNAATLDMDGNSLTVGALAGSSTSGVITSSAGGTLTLTTNSSGSTSFAGSIQNGSATLGLTVAGNGTLTLTGDNSYGGGTAIKGGATLQLGNGTSGQDGSIEGTSGVTDNGTLIYSPYGNLTTAVAVSGTGNVVKTGPGTMNLASNSNSYGGTTTVNQGTLIVSGELSGTGAVAVNSGATLGGGGIGIEGNVTVGRGGTIDPGAGQSFAGTVMTLGNNLTLSGTATLADNVDGSGDYDYVDVLGTLTIDPTNTDILALTVLGAITTPETVTVAEYGVLAPGSGRFAGVEVFGNGAYQAGSINYSADGGSAITVELIAVPEPETWAMMLAGLGMLIAFQRMRRRV